MNLVTMNWTKQDRNNFGHTNLLSLHRYSFKNMYTFVIHCHRTAIKTMYFYRLHYYINLHIHKSYFNIPSL